MMKKSEMWFQLVLVRSTMNHESSMVSNYADNVLNKFEEKFGNVYDPEKDNICQDIQQAEDFLDIKID